MFSIVSKVCGVPFGGFGITKTGTGPSVNTGAFTPSASSFAIVFNLDCAMLAPIVFARGDLGVDFGVERCIKMGYYKYIMGMYNAIIVMR